MVLFGPLYDGRCPITKDEYNEPPRDKTNKMTCTISENSDQPGHPPSLIRVFAVCTKKAWVLSYQLSAQRTLWSDWADAQADLSLPWAHMSFCWFCHEEALIWLSQKGLNDDDVTLNTCLMSYANNKGADQPAHPRSWSAPLLFAA